MQTKLGIIKLLQNFKLHPTEKTPIPMKYKPGTGFMAPEGGMWLRLEEI
jgi:hypothetical protein